MLRFLRHRHGQAYIEFILILPLVLILLAGVIFFGRILYLKIALDMASYDGVRAAVEALDQAAGINQGTVAARATLEGFHINAQGAAVSITPMGPWERGQQVCCRITYNLTVGDIPFVGAFYPHGGFHVSSMTCSRVETLRSEW